MAGEASSGSGLRRTVGFRDLVLFYVVAMVGLRWIPIAAEAGPSALTGWVIGVLLFLVPLAFTVLELSTRYPQEGGIYVWTKRAFGDFGGFVTGWTYWGSNLAYLPGMLYFAASSGVFIFGTRFAALQDSGLYFIVVSLAGLALAAWLNMIGLQFGKWLNNLGGISTFAVLALLIVLGLLVGWRHGAATPVTLRGVVPTFDLKHLMFWSVLAFALSGLESGSFLGDEIKSPRRTIPRAIMVFSVLIALFYILGTLSMMLALPHGEISGLSGVMDAMSSITSRLGLGAINVVVAVLLVINMLGGVSVWLAATARLPFVAGIDNYLPRAFGKLHPRYGTPYVALWLQVVVTAVCAVIGQAGATPRAAYNVLVSLGVLSYFIPYLVMFAALIKLQGEPAPPGTIRVPGGKPVAILAGIVGFMTTAVSCVFAAMPPENEPHPVGYVIKVVGLSLLLVASGMLTYGLGARGRGGV